MAASTLLFFFGTSFSVLVLARVLQGSAAAFVWTAGPTYINGRVGPEQMGTAMAWITMGSSIGEVTGPVAGGMLYEHYGHFSLLNVAIGIILVDIILRFLMEEKGEALNLPEHVPNESTPMLQEVAAYQPDILHGRSILIVLLSNKDLLASLWVGFMTAVIRTALEMVCPSNEQKLHLLMSNHQMIPISLPLLFNWSESYSGLVLLCLIGPSLLGPVIGSLTNAIGPRYPSALSFLALGPVFVVLGFATENTMTSKIIFCICVLAIGATSFTALIAHWCAISVLADNCEKEMQQEGKRASVGGAGKVYALMNIATAAGMLLGPIWADLVAQKWGWLGMCISFGAVAVLSGVIEAFAWRRWVKFGV